MCIISNIFINIYIYVSFKFRSHENEPVYNEIALIKKQCTNFIEQTKNYDENLLEIIKVILIKI